MSAKALAGLAATAVLVGAAGIDALAGRSAPAADDASLLLVAKVGDASPVGSTFAALGGAQAARDGVVAFAATLADGRVGVFRHRPGRGLEAAAVFPRAGAAPQYDVADDGTVAAFDPDTSTCRLAVAPPDGAAVIREMCSNTTADKPCARPYTPVALVGRTVYFVAFAYTPTRFPACGGTNTAALFTADGTPVVKPLPPEVDNVFEDVLLGTDERLYLFNPGRGTVWTLEGRAFAPVLGPGTPHPLPEGAVTKVAVGADRILACAGSPSKVYSLEGNTVQRLAVTGEKQGDCPLTASTSLVTQCSYTHVVPSLALVDHDRARPLVKANDATPDGWAVESDCLTGSTPAAADGTVALAPAVKKGAELRHAVLALENTRVPVYELAPPRASAARAKALARDAFDFGGRLEETPGAFTVVDKSFAGRWLTLYKASGAFEFVDERLYNGRATPTPKNAEKRATDFLKAHGLLPRRVTVESEDAERGRLATVVVHPRLERGVVHGGDIVVWLTPAGAVARVQSNYRPIEREARAVEAHSADRAWTELGAVLKEKESLALDLVYQVGEPNEPQTHLDPVFEAVQLQDRPPAPTTVRAAAAVPATSFTPRLRYLGPLWPAPVRAGSPVRLRAAADGGSSPYRFTWESDVDGPLGKGATVTARLSPGVHRIDVTVRDGNGAGVTGSTPLYVVGAETGAPERVPTARALEKPVPIPNGLRLVGDNGVSFRVFRDRTHPLFVQEVRLNGTIRAEKIAFDQFRARTTVRVNGKEYHLRTHKCVPLAVPGDACDAPVKPFFQSKGTQKAYGDGGSVGNGVTITNVPGTLRFGIRYEAADLFCGDNKLYVDLALKVLPYGRPPLGGLCLGLRPQVSWDYSPPPAGIKGDEIWDYCTLAPFSCDIPHDVISSLKGDTARYAVRDFELSVFTAIQSNASGVGELATLTRDATAQTVRVGLLNEIDLPPDITATVGAPVNRRFQPPFAPGNFLVFIPPARTELVASVSALSRRGTWDNVHVKAVSENAVVPPRWIASRFGVSFPGCNDPVAATADDAPCLHFHENWVNKDPAAHTTYSRGQHVFVFVVQAHESEESPQNDPTALANGEVLTAPPVGEDLTVWHRSTASSRDCFPQGGVDNTARGCIVFSNGIFFTPR